MCHPIACHEHDGMIRTSKTWPSWQLHRTLSLSLQGPSIIKPWLLLFHTASNKQGRLWAKEPSCTMLQGVAKQAHLLQNLVPREDPDSYACELQSVGFHAGLISKLTNWSIQLCANYQLSTASVLAAKGLFLDVFAQAWWFVIILVLLLPVINGESQQQQQ